MNRKQIIINAVSHYEDISEYMIEENKVEVACPNAINSFRYYNKNILTDLEMNNIRINNNIQLMEQMERFLPGNINDITVLHLEEALNASRESSYHQCNLLPVGYITDVNMLILTTTTLVKDDEDLDYVKKDINIYKINPKTKLVDVDPSKSILYKLSRLLLFFLRETGDFCLDTIPILVKSIREKLPYICMYVAEREYILHTKPIAGEHVVLIRDEAEESDVYLFRTKHGENRKYYKHLFISKGVLYNDGACSECL